MADASLTARIGGDATGLAAALDQADKKVEQFGRNIAKKIDMKAATMAAAAAIGFNIQSISESIARFVSGVSKEQEQDLKDMEQAAKEAADSTIAFNKAQMADADKIKLNLLEQERAMAKINDQHDRSAKAVKERYEAQTKLNRLQQEELDLREKIAKAEEAETQKRTKDFNDWMAENQKADADAADNRKKAAKEEGDAAEKYSRDYDRLNAKLKDQQRERMSDQEKAAALEQDIAEKRKKQTGLDKDSNEWKKLQVEINDAEKQRGEVLAQIKQKEDAITDTKKAQLKLVGQIAEGMSWGTSKNWANASDKELQELLRRNREAAAGIGTPGATDIANSMRLGSLNAESANIEKELAFRSKLRSDYRFRGEDYARSNFAGDPLAFDRVLQQVLGQYGNGEKQLDEMRKQTDLLRKIVPPAGTQRATS